jgi:hypothetical protein
MLSHRIDGGLEEVGRTDAWDFDGILKRQENPLSCPRLGTHGQKILAAIYNFSTRHLVILSPAST